MNDFRNLTIALCLFLLAPLTVGAATFTVTDPADTTAVNTLRWAIAQANATSGHDTIIINVSTGISTPTALPPFTERITLEGNGTTITSSGPHTVLDLATGSDFSIINNLILINSSDQSGIGIRLASNNNQITNCLIGTDCTNSTTNGFYESIWITGAYNLVGGDMYSAGNIIGENYYGVYVAGDSNSICGNIIGLAANQSTSHQNNNAIYLDNAQNNRIGLPSTGWGNVIGDSSNYGIWVYESNNNRVQNNLIGINNVNVAHSNSYGVYLYSSSYNLIGGNGSANEGNIVSGNASYGIRVRAGSTGNSVCGNVVGLAADQSSIVANNTGVEVSNTSGNIIGLPTSGWGNVICGNNNYGIGMYQAHDNRIQNNRVGLNASDADHPNNLGIHLYSCNNNLIGGNSNQNEGNVVSGNDSDGVALNNSSSGNTVCGNTIGLTADQSTVRPNSEAGVFINNSNENTVGLPLTGWGNVIGGNDYGILVEYSSDATIQNNLIGTNASGAALGNGSGIRIADATNVLVGGRLNTSLLERNVIAANWTNLYMVAAANSTISGNYINISPDGTTQLVAPSQSRSIYMWGCYGNLFGGSNADTNNLRMNIMTGAAQGMYFNESSGGNTVTGNWMGILPNGSTPAQNFVEAITVTNNAHNNFIGLPGGLGNLIANAATAIRIDGAGSTRNALYGNTISAFTTAAISLLNGGNQTKGAPTITSAIGSAISGTSVGATDYIELFKAEPGAGHGGSLQYLGATTASGGSWSATVPALGGDYVCALATDNNNNTSAFSANVQNTGPTPTPIVTPTHTAVPTVMVTQTPISTSTPSIHYDGKKTLSYPNPAKNQITFSVNVVPTNELKITIYNLAGERISVINNPGTAASVLLDCSSLSPGIYIALISVDGKEWDKKKIAIVK